MKPETVEKLSAIVIKAARDVLTLITTERRAPENVPQRKDDDEAIDAEQVAYMLGISEWRVYDLARRGMIPSFRPSPGVVRFSKGDIREFKHRGGCTTAKEPDAEETCQTALALVKGKR